MADLLSVQEIITTIDQAGNQDGVATLEDIKPRLDPQQKISLSISPDLNKSEAKFRQALASLNRICGLPADTFQISSVLRCPFIQNEGIDSNRLKESSDAFVVFQLDTFFYTKKSDKITQWYKDLLVFARSNQVPLSKLFNIFEKTSFEETTPLLKQAELLCRLSLFAAMWHLKYNIRAFSPEEIAKYPEWFRKKIGGFEDYMLPLLENAKVRVAIVGDSAFSYDPEEDIIKSPSSKLPIPVSLGSLNMAWHELFHYYHDRKVPARPIWMEERDAYFVTVCILLKMMGAVTTKDESFSKIISSFEENLSHPSDEESIKTFKKLVKGYRLLGEYALALLHQRQEKKRFHALEKAANDAWRWYALANIVVSTRPQDLGLTFDFYYGEPTLSSISSVREQLQKEMESIKSQTYVWPRKNSKQQRISFFEMAKRLHEIGENELDTTDVHNYLPCIMVVLKYAKMLATWEQCDIYLEQIRKGKVNSRPPVFSEYAKTSSFILKYSSALWAFSHHFEPANTLTHP